MKIGNGSKTAIDPQQVQCVPCGYIWLLMPDGDLRCPNCQKSHLRTPPLPAVMAVGQTGGP